MEQGRAAGPRAGQRPKRQLAVAAVLLALFAANFLVSVVVPYLRYSRVTYPEWERAVDAESCDAEHPCVPPIPRSMIWDGLVDDFALDASMTLTGAYLFPRVGPFPWQPFVWLAAVASAGGAWRFLAGLTRWPRIAWSLASALLISGFGAYYWSSLGD